DDPGRLSLRTRPIVDAARAYNTANRCYLQRRPGVRWSLRPRLRGPRRAASSRSGRRMRLEKKRVANLFTTVGGTRSNACSSTGGGGVCAEESSAGSRKGE